MKKKTEAFNMDNLNNTQGGNKRKEIETDSNIAKGAASALVAGSAVLVAYKVAKGAGKTILKIGRLVIKLKKSK